MHENDVAKYRVRVVGVKAWNLDGVPINTV